MSEVARPIGLAELVADQPVDGFGIRNAQQCLGEAEQCHPFLRRQRVFMQERVDAALAMALAADRCDQPARSCGDAVARLGWDVGRRQDLPVGDGLVETNVVADRGAQGRGRRGRGGKDDIHGGPCLRRG